MAFVNNRYGSDNIVILPAALFASPQAFITKGSFTDKQNILSIPLAFILSALSTYPGRCSFEQVEVMAPGNPNKTTLPFPKISLILLVCGSPSIRWKISISGI